MRIVPLGGLGEIGRNTNVIEYNGHILLTDCRVLFPEDEQPGVDLFMVDSTNAEVTGLEGDKTGIPTVSKWAEGAKSLAAASPKRTGMPLLWMKGFGRGVWSSAKAVGLYTYAKFDNEVLKFVSHDPGKPSVRDRYPRNPFRGQRRCKCLEVSGL